MNPRVELDRLLELNAINPILGDAKVDAGGDELRFLVAGHLYGSPASQYKGRTLPAVSFTDKLGELRGKGADFMVLTGDFVRAFRQDFLSATLGTLSELEMSVFNAPGNHEIGGKPARKHYRDRWGATFGGFRIGSSLFLILDTELDPWKITGDQLQFLGDTLAVAPYAGVERAFIFAHRVLFAADDPRYRIVWEHCNSRADWNGTNYTAEVLPLLAEFASKCELTWISGDIGGVSRSYGLFHDFDERHNIRYIGSGIGEQPSDNVLSVRVSPDGTTDIEVIPLKDPKMKSLANSGLEFWKQRSRWLQRRQAERLRKK